MPRIFRPRYPIGVFVPFTPVPCVQIPGQRAVLQEGTSTCEVGVPYEVLMEYTEFSTEETIPTVSWLGLRPAKDSQTSLDWVMLRSGSNDPQGIFQYIGSAEET
jgi:hypothetical protein